MANASEPMGCPVDGTTLVMSERSGIEIDYCPTCRGVWLDRGELDKIIERSAEQAPAGAPQAPGRGRGKVSSRATITAIAASPTSAASRSWRSCSISLPGREARQAGASGVILTV